MSYLLRGARLIAPGDGFAGQVLDILCREGRIAAIGEHIRPPADTRIIEAWGLWVSPGWIDSHVHCDPAVELGLEPDRIGVRAGVTTLIDAGSAGSERFESFRREVMDRCDTKVFALLNIAKPGLRTRNELSDPHNLDLEAVRETVARHPGRIVGVKARASRSVVGEQGMEPIRAAALTARDLGLPLVLHLGNAPPAVEESLSVLERGDVAAHVFSGKPDSLLDPAGLVKAVFRRARERGVLMDVAHGQESFSFPVYRAALAQGFPEDTVSTDLHRHSLDAPVESLAWTMSKLLALGRSMEELIAEVTRAPAQIYRLGDLGRLAVGAVADLTVFHRRDAHREAVDADGNRLPVQRELVPHGVLLSRDAHTRWLPVEGRPGAHSIPERSSQ